MHRTKKLLTVSIACVGVTVAFLLAAALIPHLLVNRDRVKAYIVAKTAQATGGKLDYERIEIGYFPLPHMVARDIQLILPDVFALRASELSVTPRILALLTGLVSIRRLTLDTPDIQVHIPRQKKKDQPVATAGDGASAFFPAIIESRIKGVFGALAAIDSGTRVEIDQGRATLVFPDAQEIRIRTITMAAENTSRQLTLDLNGSSKQIGELALHASVDIARSQADSHIVLTDIDLRPIFSLLPLPAGITTGDTRVNGDLDITVKDPDGLRCRFRFQAPTLAVKRNERVLNLVQPIVSGAVGYENDELTLTLDTIAIQEPELNLSAGATLVQDEKAGTVRLKLVAAAEQLDVTAAGNATRAIAGDLESIRTAFDVARAGRLVSPTYSAAFGHDPSGWHLIGMKASGRLSQGLVTIPGIDADVEKIAGGIVYEDDHVVFSNVSGLFKGAAFEGLDAAIDWSRQATLSITSSSVDVDTAPFFSWLTHFDELAEAKQYVSANRGRAAISKLMIRGPLTEPGKWEFDITGSPQNLFMETPLAPFDIKLSGGEIVYGPGEERSSNVGVEFLDASFVVSHHSAGIVNPQNVSMQLDGSMGPAALAWLNTVVTIPEHLQIKAPVTLSGVRLMWNRNAAISLLGELKTAEGVRLYVDFTHSPEVLQVRKIQFSDGLSTAAISASKQGTMIQLSFSGNVAKQTADRLLKTNRILYGGLEGDFQVSLDTSSPLNCSFNGRLSGNGLHFPDMPHIPIGLQSFSLTGQDGRFEIAPSEVDLAGNLLRVKGTLNHQDNDLNFDIDVDADQLDEKLIRTLQADEKKNDPAAQKKSLSAINPKGFIHLSTRTLTYGGFTWSPVRADIRIDSGNARIKVEEAQLCGISTTGEVDITPRGIGIDITPAAHDASLQETYDCLSDKRISADARYDLMGNIRQAPTHENPLQSVSGQMVFSSQNGRIKYSSTLMEIFSVLNITEVFTGGKSDLAEDGYGYGNAWVKATIGNGKIHLGEIMLDGNSLKITGQGSIDLKDDTADIILLAAPLKTVDRIVNKIPIIDYITGGALITVPLRVHGKLSDLAVVPLPPSAVGKGLLHFMERTLKAPFKIVQNVEKGIAGQAGSRNGSAEATDPQLH